MMKISCPNSYSPLRHVVLAMPARTAFDNITDPKAVMFTSMPDVEKVRREVRTYARLLMMHGVNVDVFEYTDYPNQIFLRDLAVVIDDRLFFCSPKYDVRHGEQGVLYRELVARGLPASNGGPQRTLSFEGADVLVAERRVFLSVGNRTDPKMEQQLRDWLPSRLVEAVAAQEEGIPQHLLGHKQLVARDRLISRVELDDWAPPGADVIALAETKEVVDGFASNIAVLAPEIIVMPEGCPETKDQYERNGLCVSTTPMSEIHKMGGGLTCITLALHRSPVRW
jgi:N-dimethylarginine dimethylaminohydrolase